jgi:CrcB protein
MSIGLWLAVGGIGGVGALLRFLTDKAIGSRVGGEFPWGTFAVNISGSFILGILVGVALTGSALLLAGTATIGSYTTFSTWMLETHRLGQDDDRRPLVLNVVASLVVGLGAAELGRIIGGAV